MLNATILLAALDATSHSATCLGCSAPAVALGACIRCAGGVIGYARSKGRLTAEQHDRLSNVFAAYEREQMMARRRGRKLLAA